MKIVFCTPGNIEFSDYKNGNILGTEFQILGLSKELIKRGHEVYIVRRWHKGSSKKEQIMGINFINIQFLEIPKKSHIQQVLYSIYARKKISEIRPDILVLPEILSSYFVCNLPIPKVYVTHNNPGILYLSENHLKLYIRMLIEKRTFQNCNLIIALNSKINEYLSENKYKSVVIPNALEIENYNIKTSNHHSIMYGGRFDKIKGLEILISAYSMLGEEIQKNYRLLLVGDGPNKKNIENLINSLGISDKVFFVPWLVSSEFIKKISECSLFILPSLSECMPVSLIEAMGLGKPVIASDIPGPRDIIISEYNGLLFEKGNIKELKNCIETVLLNEDFMLKIGENAKATIKSNYSFTKVADSYESIFQAIRRR